MSEYDELCRKMREPHVRHAAEGNLAAAERRQTEREAAAVAIETLVSEVERLKGVLGRIADGDVPREAVTIWRADGIHSKHDKCGHERVMYDDCDNCTSEFARSALGERP